MPKAPDGNPSPLDLNISVQRAVMSPPPSFQGQTGNWSLCQPPRHPPRPGMFIGLQWGGDPFLSVGLWLLFTSFVTLGKRKAGVGLGEIMDGNTLQLPKAPAKMGPDPGSRSSASAEGEGAGAGGTLETVCTGVSDSRVPGL